MHAKVRRESVAGYATDETLVAARKSTQDGGKDMEDTSKVYCIG